jgi:hypothetical protein
MLHYQRLSTWTLLICFLFCVVTITNVVDTKELVRKAKADLRAAENTNDMQVKNTKLDEARKLIDQIKAADPQNAALRISLIPSEGIRANHSTVAIALR